MYVLRHYYKRRLVQAGQALEDLARKHWEADTHAGEFAVSG